MIRMQYCYLVERKGDGEKFVMYGDLKQAWLKVTNLFQFVSTEYKHAKESPFGLRRNISSDLKYNSKDYRVLRQVAVPLM